MGLEVLTYNVKLLPDLARADARDRPVVRGASTRFSGAWWERWMMDEARTRRLAAAISAGGYDLVCLQEVFDEDRRAQLDAAFKKAGYAHRIAYSGDDDLLHEDSGLFFASRHAIKWSHFEEYDDHANADAWADKGVSCIALDVGKKLASTTLLVFHTHMQAHDTKADRKARRSQVLQLKRKLVRVTRNLRDASSVAAIVCGDFNIRAERMRQGRPAPTPEYAALCKTLGDARDLYRRKHPRDPGYTSDGVINRKMMRSRSRSRLDYVFAVDAVQVTGRDRKTRLRKLSCTDARLEPFFDAEKKGHLSDHFGVAVTLERSQVRRRSP